MSGRMLYTQRMAYGRMGGPRRRLHMVLWNAYEWAMDRVPWESRRSCGLRALWRLYRLTWP